MHIREIYPAGECIFFVISHQTEFMKRSTFTRLMAGTLAGSSLLQLKSTTGQGSSGLAPANLKIVLASYTLRTLSLEQVIATVNRLDISHLALKSMHLPLEADDMAISKMAKQVRDAGINLYGAGVVYMKSGSEVENAFRYAQAAGLEMIIGVPRHELLPLVEDKVKATNIKMAIHNHGPGDELYPTPDVIMNLIKHLDERIGICLDIGHVVRVDQDPIPMIKEYADRIFDMHIKDVSAAKPEGHSVEMGRGVIDIPGVLKALNKIKYQGILGLEYEKDGDDPIPGLAESVGYLRGVMTMI
jgi:sugar phosphate isomerase/epimerase